MEERINLIKEKLTGNYNQDVEYLNTLYSAQTKVMEDALATIEAINIVLEDVVREQNEKVEDNIIDDEKNIEDREEIEENNVNLNREERTIEQTEIDDLMVELKKNMDSGDDNQALAIIEKILPRIEDISKSDSEDVIYCSFTSDFEKMIFQNIFAGEKQVKDTPYANDVVYVIYSDLLLKKKRRKAAMDALDRAIYWNFLNREAREKKIDLYFSRQEIVKCLETIKKLQMISYTAEDIAACYNRYAFVFNSLKDSKSAYALYKLSYNYFENEEVLKAIKLYEESNPSYKEMTTEEIISIASDNEVEIGPNANIIKAHRDITKNLVEIGAINEAKLMVQNDYAMTRDDAIAEIYHQLNELDKSVEEVNYTEDHQDENIVVKKSTNNVAKKKNTEAKSKKTTAKTPKKATKTK